ncbi:MAG: hypothetical protein IT443_09355 [Phycisphaeraceae bacterium]|nr:hypothetical protein [Phycisphaeraceae bacterium]
MNPAQRQKKHIWRSLPGAGVLPGVLMAVCLLLGCLAGGCAKSQSSSSLNLQTEPKAAADVASGQISESAGDDSEAISGGGGTSGGSGQVQVFKTTLRRMAEDVERAARKNHWAVLRVQKGPYQEADIEELRTAWLLLPDNRTAVVQVTRQEPALAAQTQASPSASQGQAVVTYEVRVRVGRFGDAKLEKQFLAALGKTLKGKPLRQRPTFELPK